MKVKAVICLLLSGFAFASTSTFAQVAEINPYAGFYWPGDNSGVGTFQNNQLLGIRAGGYVTKNLELGGNFSWSNHFQPDNENAAASLAGALGFPQGAVRARIWEGELTYNFGNRNLFGSFVRPYVVGGIGGLTTDIRNADQFVLNVNRFNGTNRNPVFLANDVLMDNDAFFTFSYGGGVKLHRVWGPMGFFGDFRGRTIPNFFGHATNWPELSAGLTFVWGER